MADASIDYFRRLFEYERNSNMKSLASLETVPAERRTDPAFRRALDLHAHVAASRLMWLYRFGAEPVQPETYNPPNLSFAEVRALVEHMEQGWAEFLERLSEDEMDEDLEYESMANGRFRSTKSEIFTHLAGHTWYHRGQIATLVRAAGGVPAMTDFMVWSRQPVTASAPRK